MQDENATELPKQYDPGIIEGPITEQWLESKCFALCLDKGYQYRVGDELWLLV